MGWVSDSSLGVKDATPITENHQVTQRANVGSWLLIQVRLVVTGITSISWHGLWGWLLLDFLIPGHQVCHVVTGAEHWCWQMQWKKGSRGCNSCYTPPTPASAWLSMEWTSLLWGPGVAFIHSQIPWHITEGCAVVGKQKVEQWSLTVLKKPLFVHLGSSSSLSLWLGLPPTTLMFPLLLLPSWPRMFLVVPSLSSSPRTATISMWCGALKRVCVHRDHKYIFFRDPGQAWFLDLAERFGHSTHPSKYQPVTFWFLWCLPNHTIKPKILLSIKDYKGTK